MPSQHYVQRWQVATRNKNVCECFVKNDKTGGTVASPVSLNEPATTAPRYMHKTKKSPEQLLYDCNFHHSLQKRSAGMPSQHYVQRWQNARKNVCEFC